MSSPGRGPRAAQKQSSGRPVILVAPLVVANNNLAALPATEPGEFNAANNHIPGGAWNYDTAGSITVDPGGVCAFDAQNRMKSATKPVNTRVYGYGADGRRVVKTICPAGTSPGACVDGSKGAVTTRYVCDATGLLVAEYKDCQDPAGGECAGRADGVRGLLAIRRIGAEERDRLLRGDPGGDAVVHRGKNGMQIPASITLKPGT